MSPAQAEAVVLAHPDAVVEAVFLTTLRESLKTSTREQLDHIALHWAGLYGHVAEVARHLIDEEFEVRQAVARLNTQELAR